jgi:hypothetical protein
MLYISLLVTPSNSGTSYARVAHETETIFDGQEKDFFI